MLLGRNLERQALDDLLDAARNGRSGVLALVGEPGIGKTALLEYAGSRAKGMRILRARGIESEAQVPFAGLLELLRPALGGLDGIPEPQAAALAGALALRPASARDRFAVGAATLSLLAAHADEAPLLVLVDDAHWLDGSSAEALLFAVRRLVADPIAVVLAAREGEPSLLDGADVPALRMEGLDPDAAAELVQRESSDPVTRDVTDRLYRSTAGNPLALLELAPEAPQLAGAPVEGPVPVSTSIARAFLRRSGSLPERTRRLLVLAAASDGGELAVLERAAASLGLDLADLAAAEDSGLVQIENGTIEFRHPLARSAVYGDAPPQERRNAHRALADALPDRDLDRRAWHLASAAAGTDEAASAALQQAGERARARSAYTVSAAAFERAAGLAPVTARQCGLLYAAADAAWLAGQADRTVALLDRAERHGPGVALAARIDRLRARIAMKRGPVMQAYDLLVAAAEQVAGEEPALAVELLAEAVDACFYSGDTAGMLEAAARAAELGAAGERSAFFLKMAQGMALIFEGKGEAGADSLRLAVEILETSDELRSDPLLLGWAVTAPLWLRETNAGRALVDGAVAAARGRAALALLPRLLLHVGLDAAKGDRWPAAEADYDEAMRLARETGQRTELAAVLAALAWLEAREGKEELCRAHAGEARALCAELGLGLHDLWALAALGDLDLGLGRPAEALVHFEEQAAARARLGIADVDLSPAPELVEAYLRLGRPDDAAAALEPFEEQARAKGQPWALARALRCRGLLAHEAGMAACFEEALRLHERTPDVFETGRTRLAYGGRLRRLRQRVRAREELRAALELFDRLGASPWAELASAELAATGETARRRDVSTLDELTPQELQIGLLLAEGRTTREAAAALFLSPKTVEYHLRNIYRKLGIRSRDELSAALRS